MSQLAFSDSGPTGGAADDAVSEVVVADDGSAFAARAVPVATAVADRLGVPVTAVTVRRHLDDGAEPSSAARSLAVLRLQGDVAALALTEFAAERPGCLICLASHSRRWPASSVVASAAAEVVAGSERPVLVVGPSVGPAWRIGERVVACVDGQPASSRIVEVAAHWAGLLAGRLSVVTVVEPEPAPLDPAAVADNAGSYVARAVSSRSGTDAVSGGVVFDPIGPGPGLRSWLEEDPCGVVVVASHARPHRAEEPLGHRALQIVHDSPVPVLVVPTPVAVD